MSNEKYKCPNCKSPMVERINFVSGNGRVEEYPTGVWECPKCNYTKAVKMEGTTA